MGMGVEWMGGCFSCRGGERYLGRKHQFLGMRAKFREKKKMHQCRPLAEFARVAWVFTLLLPVSRMPYSRLIRQPIHSAPNLAVMINPYVSVGGAKDFFSTSWAPS